MLKKLDPDLCGDLSLLVIGSRFNKSKNSCELLIRNSWGTSCNIYSEDFECENGNIWVDHKTLEYNTYRIQRLK